MQAGRNRRKNFYLDVAKTEMACLRLCRGLCAKARYLEGL